MTYHYYQINAVNFVGISVITVILVIFQDLNSDSNNPVVVITDIVMQYWFQNFLPLSISFPLSIQIWWTFRVIVNKYTNSP